MKRKNTTRNALVTSIISMLLCVSMLVGTTFAWFTDEVVSGTNVIAAGNLDVELYNSLGIDENKKVDNNTPLFDDVKLWEPGAVAYENLTVANVGTLALNYQMTINITGENTVKGTDYKLSDVLKIAVVEGGVKGTTREAVLQEVANAGAAWDTLKTKALSGELKAEANENVRTYGLVIYWQPGTNDNNWNLNNGKETSNDADSLQINLGVKLLASQFTHEEDSFDDQYDAPAVVPDGALVVASEAELVAAINAGETPYLIAPIVLTETITVPDGSTLKLSGNGASISRGPGFTQNMIVVGNGATLEITNVTVDGGAVWTGEVDPVLLRGTVNSGMVVQGNILSASAKAKIVLGEGAVIQNNDGANAVNLGTRVGATLTLNGGEIINNSSAAGAIWGGGQITINDGKVNGNYGGIGGAIRIVTNVGTVLTMNGGEINHNMSGDVGGAIWAGSSRSNNVYVLNGGEMAYNYSPVAGGAMYAGYYETVKIGGSFEMHHNSAPTAGAIRFYNHASFVMTGGEIYDNGENPLFLNNNSASITGGRISENFGYSGGLGLTVGKADIEGVIQYNLSTNHNTAYLAAEFNAFKFAVNEADEHFMNFNFKPAAGYTYTEGDEAKLICMNAGYETYWDAVTGTFRLKAK